MDTTSCSVTTGILLKRLLRTSSFDRFMRQYANTMQTPALCDYLVELCRARGEPHERVIRRAGLDRVYGHQIFCGMKQPSRDKVIQLAIGFSMNVEEAQNLLRVARQSPLYPRVARDAAILYCLHHQLDFEDTQLLLEANAMPVLGGDLRHV